MRKPTLSALRAFEATVRFGSVRKAGRELSIDQAVISRHVRDLQDELGVTLARRSGNRLEVTEIGAELAARLTKAFNEIDAAVATVRDIRAHRSLGLICVHGFAQRWLLPRLEEFSSSHPDIDVRLDAVDETDSKARESADIDIRFAAHPVSEPDTYILAQPCFFPVVSPSLSETLESRGCSALPDCLLAATLLHEIDTSQWSRWFSCAFGRPLPDMKGRTFSNANIAIEAAVLGSGVALANDYLVQDELRLGKLMKLSVTPIVLGAYLVKLTNLRSKCQLKARFREWLFSATREFQDKLGAGVDI